MNKLIQVEVAYAREDSQQILTVQLPSGSTIEEAIQCSGVLTLFPEIDLTNQSVGIFSKICQLSDNVAAGDRIEIYRPLVVDPKVARRIRAKKS